MGKHIAQKYRPEGSPIALGPKERKVFKTLFEFNGIHVAGKETRKAVGAKTRIGEILRQLEKKQVIKKGITLGSAQEDLLRSVQVIGGKQFISQEVRDTHGRTIQRIVRELAEKGIVLDVDEIRLSPGFAEVYTLEGQKKVRLWKKEVELLDALEYKNGVHIIGSKARRIGGRNTSRLMRRLQAKGIIQDYISESKRGRKKKPWMSRSEEKEAEVQGALTKLRKRITKKG
ncbi:hypothetical protein ACFLQ2_02185 [archaeon]